MNLLTLFLITLSLTFADTKLLMIGGGTRPTQAMARFANLAGEKGLILVVPWASESLESAQNIRAELMEQRAQNVEVTPAYPMSTSDRRRLMKQIENAAGVFFTGGDQNVLMKAINNLGLKSVFQQKYQQGVIFGGTSAGTAIMSHNMITGNGDLSVINGMQIERREGLGLLPHNIIVDQHFIVRSRFNRLAGVVLLSKEIGLGVDEGTSLLVLNNKHAEVIGPTQVLLFTPESPKKLSVEVFSKGETFSISKKNQLEKALSKIKRHPAK